MAVVDITTLKGYFQTGDKPTELNFIDLIDTIFARMAEDETHETLAEAGTVTVTFTKKRHFRTTVIATATDITTVTLTGLSNGRSLDWYVKNSSGSARSITLPAGITVSAGSAAQTYYASATRVITLNDTELIKIFIEHNGVETTVFFEKF